MDKLTNFLKGIGGASDLFYNAKKNKCYIECVSLLANLVDAFLRISIILQYQIINNTSNIIDELLFQDGDTKISEREIYNRSLNDKVIGEPLYKLLDDDLYKKRNKVIHRYIISEITSRNVKEIAENYEKVLIQIKVIVRDLELQQIRTGRGMTTSASLSLNEETLTLIEKLSDAKHGI